MAKKIDEIVQLHNMEAIALGLPLVRADLPLVDQRASVLMAIGERCLETIQNGELFRLRKVWSNFLLAEQKQLAVEHKLQSSNQSNLFFGGT